MMQHVNWLNHRDIVQDIMYDTLLFFPVFSKENHLIPQGLHRRVMALNTIHSLPLHFLIVSVILEGENFAPKMWHQILLEMQMWHAWKWSYGVKWMQMKPKCEMNMNEAIVWMNGNEVMMWNEWEWSYDVKWINEWDV